ncbi:MAG: hypothetical protein AAF849_23325 [Bacteroidota bacterium]
MRFIILLSTLLLSASIFAQTTITSIMGIFNQTASPDRGILPDHEVRPTAAAIANGEDVVLAFTKKMIAEADQE